MEAEFREIDEPGSWNAIYQVASKKVFLGKGRWTFYKLCVSYLVNHKPSIHFKHKRIIIPFITYPLHYCWDNR